MGKYSLFIAMFIIGLTTVLAFGVSRTRIAVAIRYGMAEKITAVGPGKFKIVLTKISGLPKYLRVNDGTHTLELATGQSLETVVVPCANFEVYEENPFGLTQVKVSEIRVSEWRECYPTTPISK